MSLASTVDKITLLSIVEFSALQNQLKLNLIADPSSENALKDLWNTANKEYQHIGPPSRSFITAQDIQPIDDDYSQKYETLLSRVKKYNTYPEKTSIYNVRISKLVSPQLIINLSRANRWTNIKKNIKPDELYELMFQPPIDSNSITCQILGTGSSNGAMLFTSHDEDTRIYHPPQNRNIPFNANDPQSRNFQSVCLLIGGGLPFASAYRVQLGENITRIILNNGIHRVYKLAEKGVEWCPLIVSDISPYEIPETFVGTPRTILLNPKLNPALITDFLNKDITIPLKYHRVLKTIRLNWNFEQYETVLK
ncbi:MAG: hypothetical protein NWE92_13365 [Candidatus Bathyarchaeota archaeon]|nr:hypothetical protein [Candidatus Bathyarchaeota archaeon]